MTANSDSFEFEYGKQGYVNLLSDKLSFPAVIYNTDSSFDVNLQGGNYIGRTYSVELFFLYKSELSWTPKQHNDNAIVKAQNALDNFISICEDYELIDEVTISGSGTEHINLLDANSSGIQITLSIVKDITKSQCPNWTPPINYVSITDALNVNSPLQKVVGESYTCTPPVEPVVNEWWEMEIDTRISGATSNTEMYFRFRNGSLTIDKGDGTDLIYVDDAQSSNPLLTLQYATAGIYTVRIKGNGFLQMQNTLDANKITNLKNCGDFMHTDNSLMFLSCVNMVVTATDQMNNCRGAGFTNMFNNCNSLESLPKLNTSIATSLLSLIKTTAFNQDIGCFDLRRCTVMTTFADSVTTWSQANYSATLLGWLRWDNTTHLPAVGWVLKSNVSFHGGSSTVAIGSEAALARTYFIDVLNWSFTDGGEV